MINAARVKLGSALTSRDAHIPWGAARRVCQRCRTSGWRLVRAVDQSSDAQQAWWSTL